MPSTGEVGAIPTLGTIGRAVVVVRHGWRDRRRAALECAAGLPLPWWEEGKRIVADLARFNPFRALAGYGPLTHEVMNMVNGMWLGPKPFVQVPMGQIRISVTENDENFRVCARLPILDWEEVTVFVDGDQVSISAEAKKQAQDAKRENVDECTPCKHYCTFTLPHAVDDFRSTVKYESGALELVLPKRQMPADRRIAAT